MASSSFLTFLAILGVCAGSYVPMGTSDLTIASTRTAATNILGFDYIGNVERKIYLKAQLPEADRNGVEWVRALKICSDAGYRMASITTQAQEDLVRVYGSGNGADVKRWMWIDGTNFASKDLTQYYSLLTGEEMTFFNWVQGRPVSPPVAGFRNCLRWSHVSGSSGWWDIECNDKYNVLCEDGVRNA